MRLGCCWTPWGCGHSNSAFRSSGGDQRTENDDLGSNRPSRGCRFQGRLHLKLACFWTVLDGWVSNRCRYSGHGFRAGYCQLRSETPGNSMTFEAAASPGPHLHRQFTHCQPPLSGPAGIVSTSPPQPAAAVLRHTSRLWVRESAIVCDLPIFAPIALSQVRSCGTFAAGVSKSPAG